MVRTLILFSVALGATVFLACGQTVSIPPSEGADPSDLIANPASAVHLQPAAASDASKPAPPSAPASPSAPPTGASAAVTVPPPPGESGSPSASGAPPKGGGSLTVTPAPNPTAGLPELQSETLSGDISSAYEMDLIESSRDWKAEWDEDTFGKIKLTEVAGYSLGLPRGAIVAWGKNSIGASEVIVKAVLRVPKLTNVVGTLQEYPIEEADLTITQHIAFFKKGKLWLAAASPYSVVYDPKNGEPAKLLLSIRDGKGGWVANVGAGGLLIQNFLEGGLEATRTEMVRAMRDEEIDWMLRGNADFILYLRPKVT